MIAAIHKVSMAFEQMAQDGHVQPGGNDNGCFSDVVQKTIEVTHFSQADICNDRLVDGCFRVSAVREVYRRSTETGVAILPASGRPQHCLSDRSANMLGDEFEAGLLAGPQKSVGPPGLLKF